MLVVRKRKEMEALVRLYKEEKKSTGFVPTMGYLHEGHASLVRESVKNNDVTVCSIFVNPTQFNNPEDFRLYPKDEKGDISLLMKNGCDVLFLPEDDFVNEIVDVDIDLNGIDKVLEGEFRPGHFKGMVNIVSLLFQVLSPDKAYFGQKDFQQLCIVQLLAAQKFTSIEIIPSPIVREQSGLAMSSRNARLSEEEMQSALNISKALFSIRDAILNNRDSASLKKKAIKDFFSAGDLKLEYLEIVDAQTLQPVLEVPKARPVVVCVAAFAGKVRLIDNIIINS
ncbi:MAG: pantoate--beta-alanine ligase [Bacteroidetes bacterium]|nr:pantoate--beta-alanine ligase [Bacteroidota bacterium]